jgi:hypothetical protein
MPLSAFNSDENCQRIVLNFVLRYDEDTVPVVLYLLRHVRNEYEEQSAYGSYIHPGTVLRCDGTDSRHVDKPDLSAIFASFPYFDVSRGTPPTAPEDGSVHCPRGLFQSTYPQEAAEYRDADQMFGKFQDAEAGEYLRVPQCWTLLINSHLFITCGPASRSEMFAEGIDMVAEDTLLAHGPSIVRVTDFLKRVVYLPLERCTTYLALRLSIEENCHGDYGEKVRDYLIHASDDEAELDASRWPKILTAEMSAFVSLRLTRKLSSTVASHDHETLGLTAPNITQLIEYGNLNSDDDMPAENSMALTLRSDQYVTIVRMED